MRRLLFLLPIVAVVAIGAGLWLGLGRDPSALPSVLIDQPVPAMDLPPVAGLATPGLATGDLGGEPMLVNVFASWCAPCRVEHPVLTRLAEVEGVPLLGINYKDEPAAAVAWLHELGNPYERIGADPEGRTGIDLGMYGVPETFVVDADGRIRYRHAGPVLPADVERVFLPLLAELRG
ncbi:MAG: DsbE family thiol:disulfide interchange protein [Pseudomonadota bacterium]